MKRNRIVGLGSSKNLIASMLFFVDINCDYKVRLFDFQEMQELEPD